MNVLTIVYEEMVSTIIHKNSVFIKANSILYILVGNKTERKFT